MNLNEFAKEIHENAKAHGFWDEPRPFDELCALMISELAEALEEARAGRPMEWYACKCSREGKEPCDEQKCLLEGRHWKSCSEFNPKPEGIAVEMADCAIRILDYLGRIEYDIDDALLNFGNNRIAGLTETFMKVTATIALAYRYYIVAHLPGASDPMCDLTIVDEVNYRLVKALNTIITWFKSNGLDFGAIARRKHEYNKTRERLHGKLF